MTAPTPARLYRYRCPCCGEWIEVGRLEADKDVQPVCGSCAVAMPRWSESSELAVPLGIRLRTGWCQTCGAPLVRVPAAEYRVCCEACRESAHRSHDRGEPTMEWLPADRDRDAAAEALLRQVFTEGPP